MIRPPFIPFPILKNDRILLREVEESDLLQLIEISFYDGVPAKDLIDAQIMNDRIKQDYLSGNTIHWLISSVVSGESLGTCGFYRGFQDNIGEIGYVLLNAHHGKGYMSDAIRLILDFGLRELGLSAIKAVTSKENQSSINVLKRVGFELSQVVDDQFIFIISHPERLPK